jgi:hypothetical protein
MRFLIFILFIFFGFSVTGQHCTTDAAHEIKIESNPYFKENRKRIKSQLSSIPYKEQRGDTIIIPVVVHIYHNGDPLGEQENITDELVLAQIEQINRDFRRNNSDTTMTPDAFKSLAADTEIEFCLATIDPDGEETTGILRNHINTLPDVDESDCWTTDYIDNNFVKPTIWDRDDYLNIYSILSIDNFSNGNCDFFASLGYAQFPGGDASTDAVVLAFFTIGSTNMPNPLQPQFVGRTATHEIGHWLDLEHPWGSSPGSCNLDDDVADTPAQLESVFDCPSFPAFDNCTSSGDGIMYSNFMQYTDDDCMNMFTLGQRDRMRNLISVARPTLLESLCEAEVLSIESISGLTATSIDADIRVDWTMEYSDDISYVEIEYSRSIHYFSAIGHVELDQSDSKYSYIHYKPEPGVHYYRIKIHYADGEVAHSNVVSVIFNKKNLNLRTNPVSDNLQLVSSLEYRILSYRILNVSGVEMISGQAIDVLDVDVSSYSSGVYYLLINTNQGPHIFKWIKI